MASEAFHNKGIPELFIEEIDEFKDPYYIKIDKISKP
jgi:hypothetical protein